ncbi:MAG: hypothetical protein JW709_12680 [Sedimentisphaerales bacterium]|nr:hypothetical protein [Sedimentisphaerales bacterium]
MKILDSCLRGNDKMRFPQQELPSLKVDMILKFCADKNTRIAPSVIAFEPPGMLKGRRIHENKLK